MPRADPIPRRDILFSEQLLAFKNTIGPYAGTLGLSAAQVTSQAADADFFAYVLAAQTATVNCGQQWTTFKDSLRRERDNPETVPPTPALPPAVAPVAAGIEARFRALVRQIKAHTNYNPSVGYALGIEGAQQTAPELAEVQPDSPSSSAAAPCR